MTLRPTHFDALYERDPDPWGYRSRWYERRKHELTVAALPCERYRCGFEPGCSNGALAARLAGRCDRLISADMSTPALDIARESLAAFPNVEVRHLHVPAQWCDECVDLVVCSELGYYLTPEQLDEFIDRVRASIEPGGHLLAVHWRGDADDFAYPGGAARVHEKLVGAPGFEPVVRLTDPEFMLDIVERRLP